MSEDNIILYISDGASRSDSLLAGLKEKGYEVVSTNSPTQGVALLYVMHSAAAVVVDKGASERGGVADDCPAPSPGVATVGRGRTAFFEAACTE